MSFNKCLIIGILFHVLIVNNIFFFLEKQEKKLIKVTTGVLNFAIIYFQLLLSLQTQQ